MILNSIWGYFSNSNIMNSETQKVEILNIKPAHIDFRLIDKGLRIKMARHFFDKKVKAGRYQVINSDKNSRQFH